MQMLSLVNDMGRHTCTIYNKTAYTHSYMYSCMHAFMYVYICRISFYKYICFLIEPSDSYAYMQVGAVSSNSRFESFCPFKGIWDIGTFATHCKCLSLRWTKTFIIVVELLNSLTFIWVLVLWMFYMYYVQLSNKYFFSLVITSLFDWMLLPASKKYTRFSPDMDSKAWDEKQLAVTIE